MRLVPDTASYIRGWIQMVLAPNDLFSWNNKYNKYNKYNITNTFNCISSAMHTTYSVHAGILKPWRGRLPWPLVVFSFCHVFSLPLSGLNWRSLFPPWGSGPPFHSQGPRTLPCRDPEQDCPIDTNKLPTIHLPINTILAPHTVI